MTSPSAGTNPMPAQPGPEADLTRHAFDGAFYLEGNPDVRDAGLDPLDHYISNGWREGRDPAPWFSILDYLAANPDVAAQGVEPFGHYLREGNQAGRRLFSRVEAAEACPPSQAPDLELVRQEFDSVFYLTHQTDGSVRGERAFEHYLDMGWKDGRDPNAWFSTRLYLETHPDVAINGVNPFVHYVLTGRGEGRDLGQSLGFRPDLIRNSAGFEALVQNLARAVPDREASADIDLRSRLADVSPGRPIHVTVSHDNYTETLGGVQLCLRLETEALKAEGHALIHLFPGRSTSVVDIDRKVSRMGVLVGEVFAGYHDAETIGRALASVIDGREATLAVHSLIGHRVEDLVAVVSPLAFRETFYWLHDFSSLCANYALLRNDAIFCGAPPPESLACEICTYGERRQVQLAAHLAFMDAMNPTILAPSESALSLWRSRFPWRERRGVVRPHARLVPARRRRSRVQTDPDTAIGPLRIGFLGMPTIHKGWPVFARLVRRLAGDPRYEFHHLAKSTEPLPGLIWTEVEPSQDNATPMIEAVRDRQLDVALIWSLWPETFCFAAYEALAGGAVIVTNPDSGNVQDLVRKLNQGAIVEDDVVLDALLDAGDLMKFRRSAPSLYAPALAYSGMTADLILGTAT